MILILKLYCDNRLSRGIATFSSRVKDSFTSWIGFKLQTFCKRRLLNPQYSRNTKLQSCGAATAAVKAFILSP